jgi:hypothetical protein
MSPCPGRNSTQSDASNYPEHIHAGWRKVVRRAKKIPDDRMFLIWRGDNENGPASRESSANGSLPQVMASVGLERTQTEPTVCKGVPV